MLQAFAAALHGRRADYNARFVHARRLRPELDGEAFKSFFAQVTEPLVASVQRLDPAAVDALVSQAYDIALELVAPNSPITAAWTQLATAAGRFLRDQPHELLRALSNALHHLGALGEPASTRWLSLMQRCLPLCSDLQQWLRAGQVGSWLCGLAQYRAPALLLLAQLEPAQQRAVLDLPSDADVTGVLTELAVSPWFVPGAAAPGRKPQVQGHIGGFSGYGGPFACPPRVAASGSALYVRAGEHCWELLVDAWGQHLSRVPDELFEAAAALPARWPSGWSLHAAQLHAGKHVLDLGGAGAISSSACNGHTLLLSHALSFRISVIPVRA
jgi:hypothetical protein